MNYVQLPRLRTAIYHTCLDLKVTQYCSYLDVIQWSAVEKNI